MFAKDSSIEWSCCPWIYNVSFVICRWCFTYSFVFMWRAFKQAFVVVVVFLVVLMPYSCYVPIDFVYVISISLLNDKHGNSAYVWSCTVCI